MLEDEVSLDDMLSEDVDVEVEGVDDVVECVVLETTDDVVDETIEEVLEGTEDVDSSDDVVGKPGIDVSGSGKTKSASPV